MKITQAVELVNDSIRETIGEESIITENYDNIVDVGSTLSELSGHEKDAWVKSLVNRITKVIFDDRPYSGTAPSVKMDSIEYGSIVQKIRTEIPAVSVNEDWTLEDGQTYPGNKFYGTKAHEKFFNEMATFEIDKSITDLQIRQSFTNANQVGSFVNMIYNSINMTETIALDGLIRSTISNFIAETLYDLDSTGNYAGKSGVRAINALKLYNDAFPDANLQVNDDWLHNADFLRFAAMIWDMQVKKLESPVTYFNLGGTLKHTPRDRMHVITLDQFAKATDVYLEADTYHKELVSMPMSETISYWQAPGKEFSFEDCSSIDVITSKTLHEVKATNILGVMFDHEALGVWDEDRRVRTEYVPKAEFTNYFYKYDYRYFNDFDENFVVLFVA